MSESVKLHQDSPLGASTVFVIIPFSTDKKTSVNFHREDFAEWYVFGQDASCESNRQVQLMNPVSESLLRQLLDKDLEIYSESHIKKNPFTRGLIRHIAYASETLSGIDLRVLITYHADGIGTAVLINSLPSMPMGTYFDVLKELTAWKKLKISGGAYATMEAYLENLFCVETKAKNPQTSVTWGEEFPFFSLGGADVTIGPLPSFIEKNKLFIYGLSHQDYSYSGWERIRPQVLDILLDKDLSRRVEYSLYLTDVAMLEIDGDNRRDFIATWAKRRNTTENNMRIKLLFERVQLLELLLTQKFILQNIEGDIQRYEISARTPVHEMVELKNKIIGALSDYYYANTMSRQHVSGIEWVDYGQSRLRLNELLEHIKNRVELIESNQQTKNEFNNMRGNYVFQLISLLMGSSAVVSAVDVLTQFPALQNSWVGTNILWIKTAIFLLFLGMIVTLTIKYSKDR